MLYHRPRALCAGAIALGVLVAGACGCTGMKTSESQLFGTEGNYHSAEITYRIEHEVPARGAGGPKWMKYFAQDAAGRPAERRIVTLAVKYPHPGGRAGYARLECIIARPPEAAAGGNQSPNWLDRLGALADDGLPGLSMAEGIHEAMGLDVPIGELSGVLARLEQLEAAGPGPSAAQGSNAGQQVVLCSYAVNGTPHGPRSQRIAELDKLIARVRNEGSVISHSSSVVESLVKPNGNAAPQAPPGGRCAPEATPVVPAAAPRAPAGEGAIQPVSHAEPLPTSAPVVQRLPPVERAHVPLQTPAQAGW